MQTLLHNIAQSLGWRTIKQARARWAVHDGDQRAAAFAYYLLLSLLPLVFMLVSAGSLFVEREVAAREVVQWIEKYVPVTGEQASGMVTDIYSVLAKRGEINLAAFPLLIWGSLKFLRTLIRTTNRIWGAPTYNWWQLPLKSLGLLGITASAAFLGVLIPAIARLGRRWLGSYLEFPHWAVALILHLLPWVVLFFGATLIYRVAPSRPTKFSEVWIGALGTTILLWSGEWVFLVYAVHFAHFNVLYGTLSGVGMFLLWTYLSSCVGVFGICFCAALAELRSNGASNLSGPPDPEVVHE